MHTHSVCFDAVPGAHRTASCGDDYFGRGCEWHASCHLHVRDSNRSGSRDTQKTIREAPAAGLIRQCAATVASRRFLLPARRRHVDALACKPTPCRTMGGFRFSVEPFIVFRSARRRPLSAPCLPARVRHIGFSTCPCVTILRRGEGAGRVPTKINPSGSPLARSRSHRRMRILAAGVCFLQLASALSAAEPALVRLAVSEGKDIRFAHLTTRDGLSPGQIRDILQDDQGFLWFNTSGVLNRYDGYQFKSYRRDPAHPNHPAGGFLNFVFKDRSGFLWVGSNESLDRFDPVTETSTRFPIDGNGPGHLLRPVSHISQDRPGCCGWRPRPACIGWIRRAARFATTLTIRLIPRV